MNDCLHTGPKFQQRIFDLLLKFRMYCVAFIADIEKAFLMIQMAEEDRDVLRFLWVRDPTAEQPEPIELLFTRVVFGVSASPFLLNATIQHHLEHSKADPATLKRLSRAFYVDDIVTGAKDENEAHTLYQTAKDVLREVGFHLRKFHSNSLLLQMTVDRQETPDNQPASTAPKTTETDESYASSTLGYSEHPCPGETKVLGVQ